MFKLVEGNFNLRLALIKPCYFKDAVARTENAWIKKELFGDTILAPDFMINRPLYGSVSIMANE